MGLSGSQRNESKESVPESLSSNDTIAFVPRNAVRIKLLKLEIKIFNAKLREWNDLAVPRYKSAFGQKCFSHRVLNYGMTFSLKSNLPKRMKDVKKHICNVNEK